MPAITIRGFEMQDWEDVAHLFLSPKCRWGTMQMPYLSRDDIKHKLENPPPRLHRLVAVLQDENRVVGMSGVHRFKNRRRHVAELGMFVHDDYQDQGIGSKLMEAIIDLSDNWFDLKRLELQVYVDNKRAIHLYEKYGFVIEGTLRAFVFRGGEYVDARTMARVRA